MKTDRAARGVLTGSGFLSRLWRQVAAEDAQAGTDDLGRTAEEAAQAVEAGARGVRSAETLRLSRREGQGEPREFHVLERVK